MQKEDTQNNLQNYINIFLHIYINIMDSNRISATGTKDIEADTIDAQEITVGTNNVIVDQTGLQVYHPYNLELPLVFSGFWNVHDEIENIQILNDYQNFEINVICAKLGITQATLSAIQSEVLAGTALSTAVGSVTGVNAIQALADKQDKIHVFSNPISYNDTSSTNRILSLKYDTTLSLDASNNLKVTNPSVWTVLNTSNPTNIKMYYPPTGFAGSIGIGTTDPQTLVDISGNLTVRGTLYKNGSIAFRESQWTTTNTTDIFYNTGNVGIGTTQPGYGLDIINSGAYIATFRTASKTTGLGITDTSIDAIGTNTNNSLYFRSKGTGKIYLDTNASTRMTIDGTGTVGIATTTPSATYKLDVSGNINAKGYYLNGSSVTMSQWTTATNDIYYNTGNIGIGTTSTFPSKVTINPIVIDRNTYDHSEAPLTITNPTVTSTTVLNDPKSVLHLCRQGTGGQSYGARATLKLCRWENNSTNSRTRLDLFLSHTSYNDANIMSFRSDGTVGIGLTNPNTTYKLDVSGNINASGLFVNNSSVTSSQWTSGTSLIYYNSGNVGIGITNPGNKLEVSGKIFTNTTLATPPANGIYGSDGTRLILYTGSSTATPFALGIDGSTMWYGVPTGSSHKWYSGTTNTMILYSGGGLSVSGGFYGLLFPNNNAWHQSADGKNRLYFGTNDRTYFGSQNGFEWQNSANTNIMSLTNAGALSVGATYVATGLLSFTNNGNSFVSGQVQLGSGGWHTASYSNIYQNGWNSGTETWNRIVYATYNPTSNSGHYFIGTGGYACSVGINTTPTSTYQLAVIGSTFCTGGVWTSSDIRIKKNIQDINDDEALQKILAVEPKKYEYIDKNHKTSEGEDIVFGFIAQQIKEVIPEAIKFKEQIIPNIQLDATYVDDVITFDTNIDTSMLSIGTNIQITANEIKEYYKIKEFGSNYIKLDQNIKQSQYIENTNKCYVYGTEINDFHSLDKSYIFTLNVCATQELYRKIEALTNRVLELEKLLNK